MGKERREHKLARRAAIEQAQTDVKFNWKSFLPVILRVSLKVFVLILAAIALQLLLVAIGIPFFATSWGQLLLVLALYFAFFRWVNAETMQFRRKQENAEKLLEKTKIQS
jgi:putative copper export protein